MPVRSIDLHAHLHAFSLPVGRYGAGDLLRTMDRLNIELCVVSSVIAIAYDMVAGNAALAADLAASDRLRGYVFANPNFVRASCEQVRRHLSDSRFVGVKLYSGAYIGQPLSCPGHWAILEVVARDFPDALVLFHCGENDPQNCRGLAEVASRFPGLTFLAGHMGSGLWREALPILAGQRNIVAEISAPVAARPRMEDAVRIMGPDRVVFGSDFPIIHPAYTLGCVQDADLRPEHKSMILYENAQRLLQRG